MGEEDGGTLSPSALAIFPPTAPTPFPTTAPTLDEEDPCMNSGEVLAEHLLTDSPSRDSEESWARSGGTIAGDEQCGDTTSKLGKY